MTSEEFRALSEYIERACGIHLEEEKAYLIETRLARLMALNNCETFGAFYQLAKSGKDPKLPEQIVNAITTNETLWFRDDHPFTILSEVILPKLAERLIRGEVPRVRIWSAASSTGQEAYSIAMTIREYCERDRRVRPEQFTILATDISSAALTVAKAARYDGLAITRGLPENTRTKYFSPDGRVWQVKPEVTEMVEFRPFNLQDSFLLLGRFDVVFIRYVLIYFTDALKSKILDGIAGLLASPGYLIVGGTETLRGLTDRFELETHAGGSFHRKRD